MILIFTPYLELSGFPETLIPMFRYFFFFFSFFCLFLNLILTIYCEDEHGRLKGCQNQVASHDLPTITQARNSQFFLFPTFVSIYRFLGTFQFSFPYFARRQLFPMFSSELLRGKLADGYPHRDVYNILTAVL